MKQTTIVAFVLGILLLISVAQAFQLNGLKETISEGQLSVGSASKSAQVATGGSGKSAGALPSSIKNLPKMVGGC
ncbi:hypothetical protein GOV09_02730 [Candidatus Woesearchaeota archaeon]|nr:hypothetical protein [Candidatus Woesearchaeota archaeon]